MVKSSDKAVSYSRQAALEAAMNQINSKYTDGSVMMLGNKESMKVETFSTGSLSLDIALGVGGLPRGRIIEVYGPESSGKTTLTLHAAASAQKNDGNVAFIDAEHALDPEYAKKLGVDIDRLIVSQPSSGEEALDIAENLIRSKAIDLVIIDSVAALTPKAELDGEITDQQMGLQARMMSKGLRKITALVSQTGCTIIFINQLRDKIGVMFGSPETTTGGKALKFYASVRLDIRRIGQLKEGVDIIGNRTKVKVVKNKVAPPFKEAETDILYGEGFSRVGDIIDIATNLNIIRKSGAWYSYNKDQLGQGKEKTRQFLIDNPDLANEIDALIREKLNIPGENVSAEDLGENTSVETEE